MTDLTWKQQSFIERMKQSSEHAQWGFDLLLKREDLETFFDGLRENGLFEPSNNPEPVPLDDGKYVRIPYWWALDYLLECAKAADRKDDLVLADKIMDVVRSVSNSKRANGGKPDNYHTNRKFSEILGNLPLEVVGWSDIDLIPVWLDSSFDRGGVGHELDRGAMRRLLASDLPDNWKKACRIAYHCTALLWFDEHKKAISAVDDYWLKEFISHHAASLGERVGKEAADTFSERLRELYSQGTHARASYLFRPAIEDHEQNHDWGGVDNRLVEALRDSLSAWVDADAGGASACIDALLNDKIEIVRRVAIHLVNAKWLTLWELYVRHLGPELFSHGHLHELYDLLRNRFRLLSVEDRNATISTLRNLPMSSTWVDPPRILKLVQRDWLSAIVGNGFQPADEWFGALCAEVGAPSAHPDFLSFRESWSGPGPTPFRPEELVELAREGTVVRRLNAFEATDTWRGPTKRALIDALEEAVALKPEEFLAALPYFNDAQRPYQYGAINGFKRLWDKSENKQRETDWGQIWPALITFFENLVYNVQFWSEPVVEDQGLTPTRDWIPPLISDMLRAGTRNDESSYDQALLPRAWDLIQILLEKSEAEKEPSEDAMTQAVNSPKGKAIESLFGYALRVCRIADASTGKDHTEAWHFLEPVFNNEIEKCRDANFEFSTLTAAYLVNIEYLNSQWLGARLPHLFSRKYPRNLNCAVSGLAHAPATRSNYRLLVETGTLDTILQSHAEGGSRKHVIERLALAYLWGDESLSSNRFSLLFRGDNFEDLEGICNFFWSVSNQDIKPEQVQRVLAFWDRAIAHARAQPTVPKSFLSNLSRLTIYLAAADELHLGWLDYVAPFVDENHHGSEFIAQLLRLLPNAPKRISSVLKKVLDAYKPSYDYDDKLKTLIREIALRGEKPDAIDHASRLLELRGMYEVYMELVGGKAPINPG